MTNTVQCDFCAADLGRTEGSDLDRWYFTGQLGLRICDACLASGDDFNNLDDERLLALRLRHVTGVSLPSIDGFIAIENLPKWVRDELHVMRADCVVAHQSGALELAAARAAALQWACKFYGQTIAGTPRIRDSEKRSVRRHRKLTP